MKGNDRSTRKMGGMTWRRFLGLLAGSMLLFGCGSGSHDDLLIPDGGWHLWVDREASWENDELFLPDEVDLHSLPVSPPTGGWEVLDSSPGTQVTLPTTVEEHYWGKFGLRPYKNAYYFESLDDGVKNGNVLGVSWWWREIVVPERARGKKVLLHVRGARLRAEVFMNRKLVGYHLIGQTAFVCDLSEAVRPGEKNLLAIRITNPGGRLAWLDIALGSWGSYKFYTGRGFGGLDRGLRLSIHDPVYLEDCWILNTPEYRTVDAHTLIVNDEEVPVTGSLKLEVVDPSRGGKVRHTQETEFQLEGSARKSFTESLSLEDAELWSLETPRLYRLVATVTCKGSDGKPKWQDSREVPFGFRWFEADGVGKNAVFRLNGNRTRLVSSISWGFWGRNGLWPSPELAEREVAAAKTLGLNCIQFHRNLGKTEVLDVQDRMGLMRSMEPGGGITGLGRRFPLGASSPTEELDTSGEGGDPETFAEKFMEEKVVRMIRDHRSHPSLVLYILQNEMAPDLRNPRIFRILRRMHEEDPSRLLVLKSGIPPINQAWMQPYDETVRHDRGDGYSGYWDRHTVGGPGVWQDHMYKNPRDFTHRSENNEEIVVWGEMLGSAVPDNHEGKIREIKANGGTSYDLEEHEAILAGYDSFLDRWGFRDAFKTSEQLFLEIGNKSYDYWGRVIETARLAEANDYLVISGWESLAIENHSGLLDNLRNFKGNPELLSTRLAPVRPAIKPRTLVTPLGSGNVLDLFLLNETGKQAGNSARLTLVAPSGQSSLLATYSVPEIEKDRFVYPLAEGVETPVLDQEGIYRLLLELDAETTVSGEETILVVNPTVTAGLDANVGVLSHEGTFTQILDDFPGVNAESFQEGADYDLLVVSDRMLYGYRRGVSSEREIAGTDDDVLYRSETQGSSEVLEYKFTDLPKGQARVTLRFAETNFNRPGARVFDIEINGKRVQKDFDIYVAAGGKDKAIDRPFEVSAPDGVITIAVSKQTANIGKFNAIKVEAGDRVIAVNCGGEPYQDASGLMWQQYKQPLRLTEPVLEAVRGGTDLLLLPDGASAVEAYGQSLGDSGVLTYQGTVGGVRASWMGCWLFTRRHPVLEALPVDCAMKSFYQAPFFGANGVVLDGEGIEVFVGYSRDHDRRVGAASFTVPFGSGTVLFHALPGMVTGLIDPEKIGLHAPRPGMMGQELPSKSMNPTIIKRLLGNSIKFLVEGKASS